MNRIIPVILIHLLLSGTFNQVFSQGLPPGWEFGATPSNHIISIPLTADPNINGYLLNPGDYIGVFYEDDEGDLVCGGATEWLGDQNTGIIAFGDDAFTNEKDGFASGETINYKFYSWSVEKEYDAEAICNDGLPVTCAVFVSNGLSGVDSIWANGYYIVASANPDSVCSGSETQLLVVPSEGSGNYLYDWSSDPPGFTSDIADPVAFPTVNTTYFVSVQDGDEILDTDVFVEVFPEPQADAGPDITICEDSVILVSGTSINSSLFYWGTNGDGTFNDINLATAEYTPGPGDINNGGVELSFTAEPQEPCTEPDVTDMNLTIISLPQIQVGNDQTICEDQSAFASATLLNAIEIFWTTSGDGTFETPTQIETQYFPGVGDLAAGQVEISATAQALSPCQGIITDQFILFFGYLPEVNAGDDQVICEIDNVSLSGTAENSQGVLWESSGDGTFDDPSNPETNYYPGPQDIESGNVDITLSAQAILPCLGNVSDDLMLTIIGAPDADAGADVTICETGSLQLNGDAVNYEEVLWTAAAGDGTFEDSSMLNTIYYPGDGDIANQGVEIQLSVQPLFPCTIEAVDQMNLDIVNLPSADAGEDFTIQLGENYLAQGNATNFSSILWTTDGDGLFENQSELETNYTPGQQDIDNAGATLTLTANPLNPCLIAASDDLYLSIDTITIVPEMVSGYHLQIYPNPSNGVFYIDYLQNKYSLDKIYVYDTRGKCIINRNLLPENQLINGLIKLNLSSYEPGIYIVLMTNGYENFSEKVVLKP